jgi:hypothetical protein
MIKNAFLPNKCGPPQAFMGNIFAPVEFTLIYRIPFMEFVG